jgi:hypothetical protein
MIPSAPLCRRVGITYSDDLRCAGSSSWEQGEGIGSSSGGWQNTQAFTTVSQLSTRRRRLTTCNITDLFLFSRYHFCTARLLACFRLQIRLGDFFYCIYFDMARLTRPRSKIVTL